MATRSSKPAKALTLTRGPLLLPPGRSLLARVARGRRRAAALPLRPPAGAQLRLEPGGCKPISHLCII